ncbi:MAG: pyridoxamine 5'-phosphate oxidase family protein [Deltaproteobacteria bacterium]|nr:pyridoxamine 5'-phosphate oxidase family protein [Deltaproteobacteria bacterium]
MEFQDCIDFAHESRICYVATADGDQPRIRPLGLWFADEKGFYFQTENVKAIYHQLKSNNKIELCFFAATPPPGKVLRVTGEAEFIDDVALKTKVLADRPFLKGLGINEPTDPLLVLFRVPVGEAYFWTMADNMKEARIPRIKFGQA